jgi:hypothetical protein
MLELLVAKQNDIRKKVLELAKIRCSQIHTHYQIKPLPINPNIRK